MIKCWNAEGKEVELPNQKPGDDDMSEITKDLLPLLAYLSQTAKQIITKIHIEDENMSMVITQK